MEILSGILGQCGSERFWRNFAGNCRIRLQNRSD